MMRDAYSKTSDTASLNRITLTQRNIQHEIYKFYKEHLYPLQPIPSFRHTLMWALQSQKYIMCWQFSFNGQMNWTAAEANWRLLMDPTAAMKYDIVEAAAFMSKDRTGRPPEWANDDYTGLDFMSVCMTAAEQQEEADVAEQQRRDADAQAHAPSSVPDSVPESFDLNDIVSRLNDIVANQPDDDDDHDDDDDDNWSGYGGAPPGAPPAYRAREAAALAEEESEDDAPIVRPRRPRYLDSLFDDEAAEAS